MLNQIDVRDYKSYYKLDQRETNKVLYLQFGKKQWQFKMIFVSNSEFVRNEFINWKNKMKEVSFIIWLSQLPW